MVGEIERGSYDKAAVWIVPFGCSIGYIVATWPGVNIFVQRRNASAQFPPVGYLPLRAQGPAVGVADQLVLEHKRTGRSGSERFDTAQVVVLIIVPGEIDRYRVRGLDPVAEFVRDESFRFKIGIPDK